MAKRGKNSISFFSTLIVAIAIGIIIGVVVYNPPGDPVNVPEVTFDASYDDTWGKLDRPDARGTVTHILIAWDGTNVGGQREPRTKEQAREQIEQIWHKYRNQPTDENWRSLQAKHNEDGAPHNEYEVHPGAQLVQPFIDIGLTTRAQHARIVESQFGWHLIRRER